MVCIQRIPVERHDLRSVTIKFSSPRERSRLGFLHPSNRY